MLNPEHLRQLHEEAEKLINGEECVLVRFKAIASNAINDYWTEFSEQDFHDFVTTIATVAGPASLSVEYEVLVTLCLDRMSFVTLSLMEEELKTCGALQMFARRYTMGELLAAIQYYEPYKMWKAIRESDEFANLPDWLVRELA